MTRFVEAVNRALGQRLKEDERVYLLGADIGDPYGGAFKVTRGLGHAYPDRVLSTPVSEAALVGLANGMALQGLRPIVEVMFCDFLGLVFDQLINHAAKFPAVFGTKAACPVVVRTPSGGGRGYGPTHSQSLEKHFLGIPKLRAAALHPFVDPLAVFQTLQNGDTPSLVVEAKASYGDAVQLPIDLQRDHWHCESFDLGGMPAIGLAPVAFEDCHVTVVAYGTIAARMQKIVWDLAVRRELFCYLVIPSALNPVDWRPLLDRVVASGRVATVEEATTGWHWGTGVVDSLLHLPGSGRLATATLASSAAPVPSGVANENLARIQDEEIEIAIETLVLD